LRRDKETLARIAPRRDPVAAADEDGIVARWEMPNRSEAVIAESQDDCAR
jgi:hypothetical protein